MTRSQQILSSIREATDDKEVTHTPGPPLNQPHSVYHTTYAPVFHSGTSQTSTPPPPQQTPSLEPREMHEPSMNYEEPKKQHGMSKAKHFLHGTALGAGATLGGLYAYGSHLAAAKAAGGM